MYGSPTDGKCLSCVKNCDKCTSGNTCTTCKTDFTFSISLKMCAPSTCQQGTYLSNEGLCTTCPIYGCSDCSTSASTCTLCKTGLYLQSNTCLDKCKNGFTSNTNRVCESCNTGCLNCEFPSKKCIKCDGNLLLFPDGTCMTKCPDGYYSQNGYCLSCIDQCLSCTNGLTCNQCKISNARILYDGNFNYKCVEKCPDDYYYLSKESVATCDKCLLNCQRCENGASCSLCDENYFYNEATRTCARDCPDQTYPSTDSRKCVPCGIKDCKKCTKDAENIVCNTCGQGIFLNQNLNTCEANCSPSYTPQGNYCIKCTDSNCLACAIGINSCNQCGDSFYLLNYKSCVVACPDKSFYIDSVNKICERCLDNCKTCTNSIDCQSCKKSFLKYTDTQGKVQCVVSCPSGTYTNTDSTECLACPETCLLCTSYSICNQCKENLYKLEKDNSMICVADCPDSFRINKNTCERCAVPNCKSCSSSATFCDKCDANLALSIEKTKCLNDCEEGSIRKINERNENICVLCSPGCSKCKIENSPTECISCMEGWFLMNNQCLKDCPNKCYRSETERLCLHCPSNCELCKSDIVCEQCSTNYFLEPWTGICKDNENIQIGYYGNQETKVVTPCEVINCESCKTSGECEKCSLNFYYHELSLSCLEKCPPSFIENIEKRSCDKCTVADCNTCSSAQLCQVCAPNYYLYSKENLCKIGCFEDKGNQRILMSFIYIYIK
jgi:proprotein convertase subtilisin/kexin type 5